MLLGAVFVIGSWWAYKLLENKDSSISQQEVKIDETVFPDPRFRAYVSQEVDTDGDGVLSEEEYQQVREINIDSNAVRSMEGVEYFPNLEHLYCSNNRLQSLDLSQNPELVSLSCAENSLTSLDLSQNPELVSLYCSNNSLTVLDLSQNPALESLACRNNSLTSLDLSQNPRLDYISCSGNNLTSLDLSNNSWIGENNLSVDDGVEIIR